MKNFIFLILILTITSCESDISKKFKKIDNISSKHLKNGFYNISDIDSREKGIMHFSKYLLEKQNITDDDIAKKLSDSIFKAMLIEKDIDIEEYRKDYQKILEIDSTWFNTSDIYSKYQPIEFQKRLIISSTNRGGLNKGDLINYSKNGIIPDSYTKTEIEESLRKSKLHSKSDVEKWFSGVNGSIKNFVEGVKVSLDDPDSFQHIETSYNNKHEEVIIRMKFRCKNNFNATVTHVAQGILNVDDGTVSDIKILNN